jgi:hypothetical protein
MQAIQLVTSVVLVVLAVVVWLTIVPLVDALRERNPREDSAPKNHRGRCYGRPSRTRRFSGKRPLTRLARFVQFFPVNHAGWRSHFPKSRTTLRAVPAGSS